MRAVRSTGNGVEVVDVPEPDDRGEIVSVRAASICGSDFGFIRAGSRFVLGHELAGVTRDGRPVAVEAIHGCGRCDTCQAGGYNRCASVGERIPGFTVDGGMAERYAVPGSALVPLPEGLAAADGSIVETAAVAWHGVRIAGVVPGHRVAVVGGGAVGLLTAAVALARGAGEVGLVARHPHQREVGERLGATNRVDGGYDVVVEAVGTESAVARAVDLAAPGATVVVLGMFDDGVLRVPFITALLKELHVVCAMAYGAAGGRRDIDEAAALLAAHPEIADAMITHRFPIEDAAEAFRVAADRGAGAIRVVVEP